MRKPCLCIVVVLALLGCDSKPSSEDQETTLEKGLSTQLDSLDKAKSVEQQLKENAEKRKLQIDQRGG